MLPKILHFVFFVYLLNPLHSREVQYVRTTQAKELSSLNRLEFEIKLGRFNPNSGTYSSTLRVPNRAWVPASYTQTYVQIPNLKVQRVSARIGQCEKLLCEVIVDYPYRGLEQLSAFILWPLRKKSLMQLPIEAIISPNGAEKYVFIEENKKAIKREIQLVNLNGVFGVTEDVRVGEYLIIFGQERLVDGENVEVIGD